MKILRMLRNYICYCGIEKDEYKVLKKDAYIANFQIWRILHCMLTVLFLFMFISSLKVEILTGNSIFYLSVFIYLVIVSCLFLFVLKKDSIIAQLIIYLSISILFIFGALITQNSPQYPSTTFIVLLIIAPMFMIDKPYFMGIELFAASTIFLIWMYGVKAETVWKMDLINVIVFALFGFFIHVIYNSIRIREFVLSRKINIQKDTDELTGLKNKGAITREINAFLNDETKDKGIMFLLDINKFKSVNDTYGHDIGDSVINQLGQFLNENFKDNYIVGRFGGDEFIVFLKDIDNTIIAKDVATRIIDGSTEYIKLPDETRTVSVSIGIAIYHGQEKNYSEIFKKADIYRFVQDKIR